MDKCPRCGREQSAAAYCVEWSETECIRFGSVMIPPDRLAGI